MKKLMSLLLAVVMLTSVMAGCSSEDEEESKGAIIPVYLSTEITNFDPIYAYTDVAAAKVLNLIFDGLTTINEKGEVELELAKSIKIVENPDEDLYKMQITLNKTAWSDGRSVSADDVVYAFKRILEPEFNCDAAAMLFDIKNARAVKTGDASIDDLGVYAVDQTVVEIHFEQKIDYELFKEYLASPALVPLREDIVAKHPDWASITATMVCSGPFYVKSYTHGEAMTLERSIYYYRDTEKDEEKLDKFVKPYRLYVNFKQSAEEAYAAYQNGEVLFQSEIPMSQRASAAVEPTDLMNTHTYVFNTTKAPFNDPNVRKALSMALDRNAIVDIVKYAKAAEGFVPAGVYDTAIGDDFRANGGSLISASGDIAGAKSLMGSVSAKSFTITIRPTEVNRAVAEYAKGVWEQLGFSITIKELGREGYIFNDYDFIRDLFQQAYDSGDFDVIAIDWQAASTDAFSILAPFATTFSGGAFDLASGDFSAVPHISGYADAAYDELIETVFANKDRASRSAQLHEAEKKLAEAMPVIPLYTNQQAYMISEELSKIEKNYYEGFNFKKTKYANYVETTMADTSAEEPAA